MGTAVDAISATHDENHIIAVAHFGVILTQIQRAMGTTPAKALGHKIDNLSVTELRQDGAQWSVVSINKMP